MGRLCLPCKDIREFVDVGKSRQYFLEKIYEAGGPVRKTEYGYYQAGMVAHMEETRTHNIILMWPDKEGGQDES